MNFENRVYTRLKNTISEMITELDYLVNKANIRPTVDKASMIKSLSESISILTKVIPAESKNNGDEK